VNAAGEAAGETLPLAPPPGYSARPWPPALAAGRLRVRPEDFLVSEELGFEPTGEGAHRLLKVRKRGANTAWVAGLLARELGVRSADIGYAGLKDRHAETEQWFSVPAGAARSLSRPALADAGVTVLEDHGHDRKLRPGAHRANRFRLVLREVAGDRDEISACLTRIAAAGVPNLFGPQRFGRGGRNLDLAQALAGGGRLRRHERGFALSAARSVIFNELLARRVADGTWQRLLPGDRAGLAGSRSHFQVEAPDSALEQRLADHDIHPTGPLWGSGAPPTGGAVRALEEAVAATRPELRDLLGRSGMKQERRPLRLSVEALEWEWSDAALVLSFRLVAGGFATAVIAALA
jgi:tRNA pseudouridine13 synthase